MNRLLSLLILLVTAFCLTAGCSDDPATPTTKSPTLIDVDMPATATAFTRVVGRAGHPLATAEGSFALQGFNKHYDFGLSAVLLSLQVTNTGDQTHAGPVSLTFHHFLPFGVILLNPPEGEPTYEFPFSDSDGMWSPAESSLPLTIAIAVAPQTDFSFTAELGLGFGPQSGVVRGVVWRDENGDGVRDATEPGTSGLAVDLFAGSSGTNPLPVPRRVYPDQNGEYGFGGLAAGLYHVRVESRPYLTSSTPLAVDLELMAADGYVAPVDSVDFGFTMLAVDTLTLAATADATIRADNSARANDNHGADPYLGVGTTRESTGPNDAIRGLVRFDLAFVEQPVVAAYLEMTIASFRDGFNQTYQLNLHPIVASGDRTPWIEGNGTEVGPAPEGVVWVDDAYGVAWIGAGDGGDINNQTQPDFDPLPAASTVVVQSEHASGDVISWDVTDLVNSWREGTTPNYGVFVRDVNPDESFRQVWFWSRDALLREYEIGGAQEGPRLVLMFE